MTFLGQSLTSGSPLQIAGTINAYCALQAQRAGFRALYLSGAGVANASYGLPDLGMTSAAEVAIDIARITSVCDVPLLVDADAGWGEALQVQRTVKLFERAGAGALHLEDQVVSRKRCGHRPDKRVISAAAMRDKLKAALDARTSTQFGIMARTDAVAVEGLNAGIERAQAYVEEGADAIFAEALTSLEDIQKFTTAVNAPVLVNMTEFGQTPLFDRAALANGGVSMILYPLSAFRAMALAAESVYESLVQTGSQADQIERMQTRDALYQTLDYHRYEAHQNASNQEDS